MATDLQRANGMALTLTLFIAGLAGLVQGAEPVQSGPPFTDANFHEYLLYDPDTPRLDILIMPPASPTTLQDMQTFEQGIRAWSDGIQELAPSWLAQGLKLNSYNVGREPIPMAALWDPEIVVLAASFNPVRMGLLGIGLELPIYSCHGINFPLASEEEARALPNFHSHPTSGWAIARAPCDHGGYTCFVINMEAIGNDAQHARNVYDLNSHEVGHCLGIGHVGDAGDFQAAAYPSSDIMNYEDGQTVRCVSTLNVDALARTYGYLLGQGGSRKTAGEFVHQDPSQWRAATCHDPKASVTDVSPLTGADPLGVRPNRDDDRDGIPNPRDECPGFDDHQDGDGDGIPNGCDSDNNDGPRGDRDGDEVINRDDQCPGIADSAAACAAQGWGTFYFGRGKNALPSGNLDYVAGNSSVNQNTLTMARTPPNSSAPAVILAPWLDGATPHNGFYDPAEWTTTEIVSLDRAAVAVIWWAAEPITGPLTLESWDVKIYFNKAATAAAEILDIEMTSPYDGTGWTEYRATFASVTGTGKLNVLIEPGSFANQQDYLILYDSIDFPSRVILGPDYDSDGDGVSDTTDQCPGFDDRLDLDGDEVPDGCDPDRDDDGVANEDDAFPDDASESLDTDGDGRGDNADVCSGHNDFADLDRDGTPDGCDDDRDGDGYSNDAELAAGSNPDDPASRPVSKSNRPPGNRGNGNGGGPDCSKSWLQISKGPIMCRRS